MSANHHSYDFTLILGGIDDLTEELVDALYEAGCDDATAAVTCGVPLLDFTREAESFPQAVISALKDVAKVAKQFPNLRVVRVEVPDQGFLELINSALSLPPTIPSSLEKTVQDWLADFLRNKTPADSFTSS
jgi:hypothetical protein